MSFLRDEALRIVADLRLMEILSAYGDPHIVGSIATDLVVKLDIDVHVVVSAADLFSVVDAVYHQLLDNDGVHDIRISDYRTLDSLKIGIDEYTGPSGDWSIDIWVTHRPETGGLELTERLKRELTAEHRRVIMELKQEYHQRGLLRDGLSRRIYLAVVDEGVRTLAEFESLLSKGWKE